MTTYKEAGVDIDLANQAVVKIKDLVKGTFNENTLTDIGVLAVLFISQR